MDEPTGVGPRGLLLAGLAMALAALVAGACLGYVLTRPDAPARDTAVLRWFLVRRTPALLGLARDGTDLGLIGVLLVLAVIVGLLLRRGGLTWPESLAPLVSLVVVALITLALKSLVGRAGPQHVLGTAAEPGTSFPSGHAADATALFVSIALLLVVRVVHHPLARTGVVVVGLALPLMVGLSRLVLDVHWPTDVVAGWALGAFVAVGVTVLALRARAPAVPAHARPD
jgi:undecaprenyl-diphosphatase